MSQWGFESVRRRWGSRKQESKNCRLHLLNCLIHIFQLFFLFFFFFCCLEETTEMLKILHMWFSFLWVVVIHRRTWKTNSERVQREMWSLERRKNKCESDFCSVCQHGNRLRQVRLDKKCVFVLDNVISQQNLFTVCISFCHDCLCLKCLLQFNLNLPVLGLIRFL